jgi:hypothetical protein
MVIKRQYKGMVESFSELGGMMDILFMMFLIPYRIYNSYVLKQRLVEIVYGVKKPSKPAVKPVSDSKTNLKQQTETYNQLIEGIESCLDLVHLTKVVKHLQSVIKSNNLELQELDQEQAPRRASLVPSVKGPIANFSDPKLRVEDLEEGSLKPGKVPPKSQKANLLSKRSIPSSSKGGRISETGKPRAIQIAQNSPDSSHLEQAEESRQNRSPLKNEGRRPDQQIGRDHLDRQVEGTQWKKDDRTAFEGQRPHAAVNDW